MVRGDSGTLEIKRPETTSLHVSCGGLSPDGTVDGESFVVSIVPKYLFGMKQSRDKMKVGKSMLNAASLMMLFCFVTYNSKMK